MKKSERLLELMAALRRRRYPVAGHVLAEEMGVTLRTLYRDIDSLRGLGAQVSGEAGIGYQLDSDFFLPPMMLTNEEIEALVLGLRSVIYGPDSEIAEVAKNVRAKISASLPKDVQRSMDAVGLFAVPNMGEINATPFLSDIRKSLRDETEINLTYVDAKKETSTRVVWPVSLGYIGNRQMLVAWCTLRRDYRSFWIDRMQSLTVSGKKYARPRRTLQHEWRQKTKVRDLT